MKTNPTNYFNAIDLNTSLDNCLDVIQGIRRSIDNDLQKIDDLNKLANLSEDILRQSIFWVGKIDPAAAADLLKMFDEKEK
jgi:hypothetical protein